MSSGQAVADEAEAELRARGLENDVRRRGGYRFLCSGDPDAFRRVGTRFLALPLGRVERIGVAPSSDRQAEATLGSAA